MVRRFAPDATKRKQLPEQNPSFPRGTVSVVLLSLSSVWGCVQSEEVLTRKHNHALSDAGPADAGFTPGENDASNTPAPSTIVTDSDAQIQTETQGATTDSATSAPSTNYADVLVGTGYYTTCASVVGKLYCWGDNTYGQLGTNNDGAAARPRQVSVDFVAAAIDGGERHMCALSTTGDVYCWGNNDVGQLGQNDTQTRREPVLVVLPEAVRTLSSGESHVCVIGESGRLYGWGKNDEGQLTAARADDQRDAALLSPALIDEEAWRSISAGQGHSCGTKADGSLWCWGRNADRQAGQNDGALFRTPERVGQDNDWLFAVSGQTHSCAVRNDKTLWCWGGNLDGAPYPLGSAWSRDEAQPQRVSAEKWQSVHTRGMSTCGLTTSGEAWCWGRNDEGQLGLEDLTLLNEPTFIARGGTQVATGLLHTCGVSEARDVYCAGDNQHGQLGLGDGNRRKFGRVRF